MKQDHNSTEPEARFVQRGNETFLLLSQEAAKRAGIVHGTQVHITSEKDSIKIVKV